MIHPLHPENIQTEFEPSYCSMSQQSSSELEEQKVRRLSGGCKSDGLRDQSSENNTHSDNALEQSPNKAAFSGSLDEKKKKESFTESVDEETQDFKPVKLHDKAEPVNIQGHVVPKPSSNHITPNVVQSESVPRDESEPSNQSGLPILELDSQMQRLKVADLENPIQYRHKMLKSRSIISQESFESCSSFYRTPRNSFGDISTDLPSLPSLTQESHDHDATNEDDHVHDHDHTHTNTSSTDSPGAYGPLRGGASFCTKCVKYRQEIRVLHRRISTLERTISQNADIQENQVTEYNNTLLGMEQENYALKERLEDQNQRHIKAEREIAALINKTEQLTTTVSSMNERHQKDQMELQKVKSEAYDYIKQIELLRQQLAQVNYMQCSQERGASTVPSDQLPYVLRDYKHF